MEGYTGSVRSRIHRWVSGFCGGGILAASILEVDVRWHHHKVVDSSLCRWGHDRNYRRRWVEGLG